MKFVVGPSRNRVVADAFALHDAATRAAKKAKPEPDMGIPASVPTKKPATKKAATKQRRSAAKRKG